MMIRRLFCKHRSRTWQTWTELDRGLLATVTRGVCDDCGKPVPPLSEMRGIVECGSVFLPPEMYEHWEEGLIRGLNQAPKEGN